MTHTLLQFPGLAIIARALVWLAATTLLFVPLEALLPLQGKAGGDRDVGNNLGWFFLNSLVTLPVIGLIVAILGQLGGLIRPAGLAAFAAGLPLWLRMALAMIVGELGFYWGHRWSHEWPWLWRFHCIHHSPARLHYLVNTRMHPVDMIVTRLCGAVLLILCGLATPSQGEGGLILPLVLLVGSGWSYFLHADLALRLRPLQAVISTPAFHHWHHAWSDSRSCNYAAMLPLLDRIFGTWREPAAWPPAYGIDLPVPPDLVHQLSFPFE